MAHHDVYFQNILFCAGYTVIVAGLIWCFRKRIRYHIYQRVLAWIINWFTKKMNRDLQSEKLRLYTWMQEHRLNINTNLDMLEVGSGSAANLKFFPPDSKLVCLDPNQHFFGYIKKNLHENGNVIYAELVQGYAENIPFESERFDVVISTLVLCTVSDVSKSLAEIKRVLKPGGIFLFLEHVAAECNTWTYTIQRIMNPVHKILGDGCETIRCISDSIRSAGFSEVAIEHFVAKPLPVWVRHCILGRAVK